MPKTRTKPAAKRAYLARDDRRAALLDVAAAVVEEQGWPALSMIAVAEAAQVSRQLVYQHFASVDELMADTMSRLFRNRYENIRSSIGSTGDMSELLRIVEQQTFDDHPGRVRALWQMITATYSDNAETSRMSTRLRHLLVKLWAPTLARQFGLPESQASALSWMLLMAFWGAHQLVHDGELDRRGATELFTWMVLRLQGPGAAAPAVAATVAAAQTPAPVKTAAKLAAKPAARRASKPG